MEKLKLFWVSYLPCGTLIHMVYKIMRISKAVCLAFLGLWLFSICSAQKSNSVWVNKEKMKGKAYKKVFIIVMADDPVARGALEMGLTNAAIDRGYDAVLSIDYLHPIVGETKTPSKEELVDAVQKSNSDAVLVASLLRAKEELSYTPGTSSYMSMPYSRSYYGYYNYWYPSIYSPGYYTPEMNYVILSNMYDVASEEIMWSVKSKVFNPSSITGFSNDYIKLLGKQLGKKGLAKQK